MRTAVAGLTLLCAALAMPGGAQGQGSSSATGKSITLSLKPPLLPAVGITSPPAPVASGTAPPPYADTDALASVSVAPLALGPILSTGIINVAANSNVPNGPTTTSSATVDDLALNVVGLFSVLSINADTVQSTAAVSGTCGGALTASGTTAIENATVGGSQGGGLTIAAGPAPNTVLLDVLGIRVVLNEQIITGNGTTTAGITVRAIHVTLATLSLGGIGALTGDIIVGESVATVNCAAVYTPTATGTATHTATATRTPTATNTATRTSTATATATRTSTPSNTPTRTLTPSITPTPTCANPPTSSGSGAFGEYVQLSLLPLLGGGVGIESDPLPTAGGTAPAPYNQTETVLSATVASQLLGTLLQTGVLIAHADGVAARANASAEVDDLNLDINALLHVLGLTADSVLSTATAGGCGGNLTATGSTTIVNGDADGPLGVNLMVVANPAPNTVLLDVAGLRIVLNEQIPFGNGTSTVGLTVNAIHIELDNFLLSGLGLLSGEIIIAQSRVNAQLGAQPTATATRTATATPTRTATSTGTATNTATATAPPPSTTTSTPTRTLTPSITATPTCANPPTSSGSGAFGEYVHLSLLPLLGGGIGIDSGPLPTAGGTAPAPYNDTQTVLSATVAAQLIGTLLQTGVLTAHADGVAARANASAEVDNLNLDINALLPVLGLSADAVLSTATAGGCGGVLTATGTTTIVNGDADGPLGVNLTILANPAPNTVLLDVAGLRIVLNEQIPFGNGTTTVGLTVNAIHIELDNFLLSGLGLLSGEIIIAQSRVNAQFGPQPTATATRTNTATPTRTATSTGTATAIPPSATATRTNTPVPATATVTAIPPSATATRTNTAIPATATSTATRTGTPTSTATTVPATATATRTNTAVPATATATATRTGTPTATATAIPPSATATRTNTPVPATATASATRTGTATVTATAIPATATATRTNTGVPATPTASATRTGTATATATAVPATATATRTNTGVPATATASATRTNTSVPATATATAIPPSATATRTNTPVPATATASATRTGTATATSTAVPGTATATRTNTSVPATATATATRTGTPAATSTSVPATATATRTATATAAPPTGTAVPASATATSTRTGTPTASATAIPPAATATRTATSVPATSTATATRTIPPSSTATLVPSTATPTRTATGVPGTATATATRTQTSAPPTAASTSTRTATPSATATAPPATGTATRTATSVPATATSSPTLTGTAVPAPSTPTRTASALPPTAAATATRTAVATATGTSVPATATATAPANTATATAVPATQTATAPPATSTATRTMTASTGNQTPTAPPSTATATSVPPTSTATATAVPPTSTATAVAPTATRTPVSTSTATATRVPPTATGTATATAVPPTATPSLTHTPAATSTVTLPPSSTPTPSSTPLPTATATDTPCAPPLAHSVAFGANVHVAIDPLVGLADQLLQTDKPRLEGEGPSAYSKSDTLAALDATNPLVGKLLASGTVRVVASGDDGENGAANASSDLENVRLAITEVAALLTLSADRITANAAVGGSCCTQLTATGEVSIAGGSLSCLLPAAVPMPEQPAPNTVLLDHVGMRVVLNEQILTGDGRGSRSITVNAVHIYLDDVLVSGLGALQGEVIIGHAEASLTCGCSDAAVGACVGDCSGDHTVTVDEAITCVNIGLGNSPMERCEELDSSHDRQASIDEIIRAVYNLLYGCPRACVGP